jgi:hypothetical protein
LEKKVAPTYTNSYRARIRIEKRKGIVGRVDALLDRLEQIAHDVNQTKIPRSDALHQKFNGLTDSLTSWSEDADKLFEKIDNSETEACLAAGFLEVLEIFPEAAPWVEELAGHSFKATIAKADVSCAAAIDASAARFASVVKSIKNYMAQRVKANLPKKA